MRLPMSLLLSIFALLPSLLWAEPAIAKPTAQQSTPPAQAAQAAYVEGCRMSIRLSPALQPVEVQSDSFLGYDPAKKSYVAVLCQVNAMRTFQPPLEPTSLSSTEIAVVDGAQMRPQTFHSVVFRRANHPVRRMTSVNLFFASRDHQYYVTAYPDPALVRKQTADQTAAMDADLELLAKSTVQALVLEEGVRPAITEGEYNGRLIGIVLAAVLMLGAVAFGYWYRLFRKRR